MLTLPPTAGIVPSQPPPPNIIALLFHVVGRSTWNLMLGAVVSTGLIEASTLQYSGTSAVPVPAAGTTVALVTTPPVVGKPIEVAGIAMPLSSAQVLVTWAGVDGTGLSPSPPPLHADNARATMVAVVNAAATDFILRFFTFTSFDLFFPATIVLRVVRINSAAPSCNSLVPVLQPLRRRTP